METIYYYKTISDTWHFSTGVVRNAQKGVEYLRMLRCGCKKDVQRLYLNDDKDFEKIKEVFYTPSYWEGRTWIDEYNEEQNN